MLVQQNLSAKRRDDLPDALLFPNAEAKQTVMPLAAWQRFQHGVCVVETKRWNLPLDRAAAGQQGEEGVPSTQMLRYLRRVDDVTNGGLRWGILTSGRHWRLYFRGALTIAEDFREIDLGKVLDLPGCERDLLDKRPDIFADDDAWRSQWASDARQASKPRRRSSSLGSSGMRGGAVRHIDALRTRQAEVH
jgi:hypothetical protein